MEVEIYKKSLKQITLQRNAFLGLAFLLVVSNVILVVSLMFKKERVILIPPLIDKELWVERNSVSGTYLEQFGVFFAELILNKSPASAALQNRIVLRYVDPARYNIFAAKLEKEAQEIKAQGVSYMFFPERTILRKKQLEVVLFGEHITYLGEREIAREPKQYTIKFSFSGGALHLSDLKKEEI